MKKVLAAVALVALASTNVFALSIANSKHNLSSVGPNSLKSTNQSQICVFCHTPHNAAQNIPLWNRSGGNAASSYQLYTSSASLTPATKAAKLYNDSQSLFCLSCHDGTVATLGSRVNRTGLPGNAAITMTGNWTGGDATTGPANLGQNLTNDHPVGFSYGGAAGADTGLFDAATAKDNLTGVGSGKAVFFKANSGGVSDSMECSSCHAVHDNTNSPFLRTSNSGSKLCLSCHNK